METHQTVYSLHRYGHVGTVPLNRGGQFPYRNPSDGEEIQADLVLGIRLISPGGAQKICKIETGLNFDEMEEWVLPSCSPSWVVPPSSRRTTYSQNHSLVHRSCDPHSTQDSTTMTSAIYHHCRSVYKPERSMTDPTLGDEALLGGISFISTRVAYGWATRDYLGQLSCE